MTFWIKSRKLSAVPDHQRKKRRKFRKRGGGSEPSKKKTIIFKKKTAMFFAGMISKMLCAGVFWNAGFAKKCRECGGGLSIEVDDSTIDFP